jgi:hypothetical protein
MNRKYRPKQARIAIPTIACDRCGQTHPISQMNIWQPPSTLAWMTSKREFMVCDTCVADLPSP